MKSESEKAAIERLGAAVNALESFMKSNERIQSSGAGWKP